MAHHLDDHDQQRLRALSQLTTGQRLQEHQRRPLLTFGLEIELNFAINRYAYEEWLATNPKIEASPPSPDIPPINLNRLRAELGQPLVIHDHDSDSDGTTPSPRRQHAARQRTAQPVDDPSPAFSDVSGLSMSTQDSQLSFSLRGRLLHYFLDFLNRRLPESSVVPSLLGEVKWGGTPKTASSDSWHLTWDDSVHPSRRELAQLQQTSFEEVRGFYRCVGAELVSKVMDFDSDRLWFPQLQQLHQDLQFDGAAGGAYFGRGHLQVHFGLRDEDISLELAQTLCVLYGLFENQIEKWVKKELRDNRWCYRLRLGMERLRHQLDPIGTSIVTFPEKRYTHGEFADLIYATTTLEELRTATSGRCAGEQYSPDGTPLDIIGARNWTTINISLKRPNKPTTFEFRHHHGTTDPLVIGWWVQFCGHMLRYAHMLVRAGFKLKDHTPPTPGQDRFLDMLVKENVLEVIGFPEDGKAHFAKQARDHYSVVSNDARAIDDMVVRQRCIRRNAGQQPSIKMDDEIMNEQWFKDAWARTMITPFPLQGPVNPVSGIMETPFRFDDPQVDSTGSFSWYRIGLDIGTVNDDPEARRAWLSQMQDSNDRDEEADFDGTGQLKYWEILFQMCNNNQRGIPHEDGCMLM